MAFNLDGFNISGFNVRSSRTRQAGGAWGASVAASIDCACDYAARAPLAVETSAVVSATTIKPAHTHWSVAGSLSADVKVTRYATAVWSASIRADVSGVSGSVLIQPVIRTAMAVEGSRERQVAISADASAGMTASGLKTLLGDGVFSTETQAVCSGTRGKIASAAFDASASMEISLSAVGFASAAWSVDSYFGPSFHAFISYHTTIVREENRTTVAARGI